MAFKRPGGPSPGPGGGGSGGSGGDGGSSTTPGGFRRIGGPSPSNGTPRKVGAKRSSGRDIRIPMMPTAQVMNQQLKRRNRPGTDLMQSNTQGFRF